MKKNDQRTRIHFFAKYGGLSLYDIGFGKIYSIDDEDIHFVKEYRCDLIGNQDHPDGTSTDHEYLCIHDDLFGRILENDQKLRYYNKGDSQRSVFCINQWKQYIFNIQDEEQVRNGSTSSLAPEETTEKS